MDNTSKISCPNAYDSIVDESPTLYLSFDSTVTDQTLEAEVVTPNQSIPFDNNDTDHFRSVFKEAKGASYTPVPLRSILHELQVISSTPTQGKDLDRERSNLEATLGENVCSRKNLEKFIVTENKPERVHEISINVEDTSNIPSNRDKVDATVLSDSSVVSIKKDIRKSVSTIERENKNESVVNEYLHNAPNTEHKGNVIGNKNPTPNNCSGNKEGLKIGKLESRADATVKRNRGADEKIQKNVVKTLFDLKMLMLSSEVTPSATMKTLKRNIDLEDTSSITSNADKVDATVLSASFEVSIKKDMLKSVNTIERENKNESLLSEYLLNTPNAEHKENVIGNKNLTLNNCSGNKDKLKTDKLESRSDAVLETNKERDEKTQKEVAKALVELKKVMPFSEVHPSATLKNHESNINLEDTSNMTSNASKVDATVLSASSKVSIKKDMRKSINTVERGNKDESVLNEYLRNGSNAEHKENMIAKKNFTPINCSGNKDKLKTEKLESHSEATVGRNKGTDEKIENKVVKTLFDLKKLMLSSEVDPSVTLKTKLKADEEANTRIPKLFGKTGPSPEAEKQPCIQKKEKRYTMCFQPLKKQEVLRKTSRRTTHVLKTTMNNTSTSNKKVRNITDNKEKIKRQSITRQPEIPDQKTGVELSQKSTHCVKQGYLGQNSFVCSVCSRTFRLSSSLEIHKKCHNTASASAHTCKYCYKKFEISKALDNHLLENCARIPSSERKKLLSKTESKPSNSSGTKESPKQSQSFLNKNSKYRSRIPFSGIYWTPNKPLICDKCKKKFDNLYEYTTHMTDHFATQKK